VKKISILLPAILLAVLPLSASAHQQSTYTINGATYNFVVGSLNEPVAVDDKTGVDFTVTKGSGMPTMSADGDMDGMSAASAPVTGLESAVKVELIAGTQKKTFALSPVYGKPGSYSAAFYPTVATTLAYHFTGTINSTPIDLTFTCIPAGSPKATNDTTHVQISDKVMRISNTGGFGCPVAKEDLGFPEQSASVNSIENSLTGAKTSTYASLAVSIAALVLALYTLWRRRS
jgi:hypothetical protein